MTDHQETVVLNDSGGRGMGMVLGIIAIIVLLAAIWFLVLSPGRSSSGGSGTDNGGNAPAATQQAPAPAGSGSY